MSEIKVSGRIFANPESIKAEGEAYVIRSKNGQGWGLPVDNLEPEDLRVLADRIEKARSKEQKSNTFEDKAKDVLNKFISKTGVLSHDGTYSKDLLEIVGLALKEQDRDTRHRCAEAVIQCEDQNDLTDTELKWIDASDAHSACMNSSLNK